jgi:dihydrofolate reductase
MRKVIASELVSLDGVMEAPETWHLTYFNDEMGEAIGAAMAEADAFLFGRVTYEEFAAFWPSQSGDDQEFEDYMNNTPKYVVSTTLEESLKWELRIMVHPVVVGRGKRLFEEGAPVSLWSSWTPGRWHGRHLPHLPAGGRAGRPSRAGVAGAPVGREKRTEIACTIGRRVP